MNKQIILLNGRDAKYTFARKDFYSVYFNSFVSFIDYSFQYSILEKKLWTNHARIKLQPRLISTKFESQLQYSYPTSTVFAMCKQRETQKHILTTGSSF